MGNIVQARFPGTLEITLEGRAARLFDHNKTAEKCPDLLCIDPMNLLLPTRGTTHIQTSLRRLDVCVSANTVACTVRSIIYISGVLLISLWMCFCVWRPTILPHSFTGSSDQSLQSFTLSHTLLLSMHSPFLQRNFFGPSHFVTVEDATHTVYRQAAHVVHWCDYCCVQGKYTVIITPFGAIQQIQRSIFIILFLHMLTWQLNFYRMISTNQITSQIRFRKGIWKK